MAMIAVKKGVRKELMTRFSVSAAAITYALNFKGESLLRRRIRSCACNNLQGYYINFPK